MEKLKGEDIAKAYEDLINNLLNGCASDSCLRKRIVDENELFRDRKWQTYIMFLRDLLSDKNFNDVFGWFPGGSALNSCILRSCIQKNINEHVADGKSKDILFNDALRYNAGVPVLYHDLRFNNGDKLIKANGFIDGLIERYNLYKKEFVFNGDQLLECPSSFYTCKRDGELLVLSTNEIPDSDFDIIINEKINSSPKESEILRKYLIIILCKAGI